MTDATPTSTSTATVPPPTAPAPDAPRGSPAAPAKRRTQAERRAASQRRLLDAATTLIAERGTATVGFGEIAKAAGVSHGLPSYLFGTKVGLLVAMVDDFAERIEHEVMRPAIGTARGPRAFGIALRFMLETLRNPWPGARALNIVLGEVLRDEPELRAAVNRYHDRMRGILAGWVREGIEDGDIQADVRPEEQAALWMAVVRGLSYQAVAGPEAMPIDTLADELFVSIRRIFGVPDDVVIDPVADGRPWTDPRKATGEG
jgi:AcrR family transcriptional regulator